ncbi:MAG: D-2-hydroxyacid dehydrogenase family protein [Candidatus Latescibacteria bacterium]|nr:D-2-hydroxyacid dehydrogenase family protein [Candidatus Latescibacterota bacterium]
MKKRIAVLDDYLHLAATAAAWDSLDAEVVFFHDTLHDTDALVQRLAPFHALVTMRERTRFPGPVLERLPNLQLIAGTGRRQANVDLAAATQLGIPVCVTTGSGAQGNTTAELTWGLVLALTRHIAWEDQQLRQGRWQTRMAEGLAGKTLGIMGLGRIGTIVAGYGRAFGMEVIAWGPTLTSERAAQNQVEYVERDQLFARSDVLSIHVVLSAQSRGWVGARELALMRPSAFLVNTARGPIIDQEALVDALKKGAIAGAALDVYDLEPLPADSPLLTLDNILLTPHLGYNTGATLKQFYTASVANLKAWMAGAPTNILNEEVLPRRR